MNHGHNMNETMQQTNRTRLFATQTRNARHYVRAVFMAVTLSFTLAGLAAAPTPARADGVQSPMAVFAYEYQEYCEQFRDPDSNNGWTTCTQPQGSGIINGDIDVEGVLFRDTIDMRDPETYIAVHALMRRLIEPAPQKRASYASLDSAAAHESILRRHQFRSARNLAADVIGDIISRRSAIPDSGAEIAKTSNPTDLGTPAPTTSPGPALRSCGPGEVISSPDDPCEIAPGTTPAAPPNASIPPTATMPFPPCSDTSPGPCIWGEGHVVWSAKGGPAGDAVPMDPSCPYYDEYQNVQAGSYTAMLNAKGQIEGVGRYYIRNNINCLGKYQMCETFLVDAGCVVPDGKNDGNMGAGSGNRRVIGPSTQENWTGQCPHPNHWGSADMDSNGYIRPGAIPSGPLKSLISSVSVSTATPLPVFPINSSEEFLRNPCAQEAVVRAQQLFKTSMRTAVNNVFSQSGCGTISGYIRKATKNKETGVYEDITDPVPKGPASISPSGLIYAVWGKGATGLAAAVRIANGASEPDPLKVQGQLWGNPGSNIVPGGTLLTDGYYTPLTSNLSTLAGFEVPWSGFPVCGDRTMSGLVMDPKCLWYPGSNCKSRGASGDTPAANAIRNTGPPKPVGETIIEIRQKAGVNPVDIAAEPSYNEIMLALTKERFLVPDYFTKTQDDTNVMNQELVMTEVYIALQMQDIYAIQEKINALLAARAALKMNTGNRSGMHHQSRIP